MVSELVPPDTPEDGLDYLRQNGTMMQLERLARALAQNRPEDVIEYMEHEFAKSRLFVLPQQRYTIPEMEQQISQLAIMFDGKEVIQEANGSRSDFITSGRVPIPPHIIETLADCMTFLTDFTQADIIVAPAVRSVASLAHACACRTGQPYSLSIWYPSGLVGDIQIAAVELQGEGRLYINSVTRGQKVIIVGDVLWNGGNSGALLKAILSVGAIPVAASFVAECCNQNGRKYLTQLAPSMKVNSLVTFDASGSRTKTVQVSGINGASNTRPPFIQYSPSSTENLLESKVERVTQSFVGVPILQTPAGYPYCKFCLTDFVPCISPDLVEDIADCLIAQGNFEDADIIVSSTDRGSAPLAHACGIRSGLPYCFSHWSPITDSDERSNARVTVHIGSMGTMEVSGLSKGSRVMLVADMLSSGGSVEVLCRAIMKNDCQVIGAVFASEKVNLNGRQRIRKLNPGIKVASVCRFVAEPADHSVKFSGVRLTEAFQDLKLSLASSRGNSHSTGNANNSPTAPRGARALATPQKCKSPPGVLESLRDSLVSPPPLPRLSSSNMSPILSRATRPSSNSSISSSSSSIDTPPSSANRLSSIGLLGFPKLSSSIEVSARNKRTGRLQSINPNSFSEEDFSVVVSRVQNIFNDIPIVYSTGLNTPYCYFSLNEGCPPMDPMLMEDIVDCITATTDAISSADILVGMAERATGALVHAIASRTGQPYTLSNWYPKGLQGELVVPMPSTNQDMKMFLNSIHRNNKVAIVGDILWDGTETIALLKAIENGSAYVNTVVFVAEAINMGGRSRLLQSFPDLEIYSVVSFRADEAGTRTYLDSNQSAFERRPIGRKNRLASSGDMSSKMERVTQSFVGVTILQTPAGYPYCKFCLTDFVPAMRPDLLEDMAECCISAGNFDEADVIIAEPGRGAGPLVHACAIRCKLPYCFASNSRSASGHVLSSSVGGFHNKGLLLRGLKAGQRVILISDMLSSGSSAETLLRQVVACGCNPVGAVFMSEKVNLNGRRRLQRLFPDIKLVVICKFVAEPADPTLRYVGERLTERFQDLQLDFKKDQTSTSAPAAPRGPRANTPSLDMPIQDL